MKGITGNPALDAYHRMAISPVGAARPAERAAPSAASSGGDAAAEVKISARARDLASEAAKGSDAAKVDSLKQRIAENRFQVDSRAVAQRMMAELA